MIKIASHILPQDSEFSVSPTLGINQLAHEKRRAGEEVFHLGFGESPFPAHPILEKALCDNAHQTGYINTSGLPNLRNKARHYHTTKFNLDPDRYECMIAPGSKLLLLAIQASVEGDILLPNPSWVSYAPQARMLQQNVSWIPTTLDETGFRIDADELKRTISVARRANQNPTKLLLNTPNNPTGLVLPADDMKAIANVCREEDILIISDEIYAQTQYDQNHVSIARYAPERTVITGGLSKHLSLGGWRLGMSLIPKDISGLFMAMNNYASESWSAASSPIQYAAIQAYEDISELEAYTQQCAAVHQLATGYLAQQLEKLGVTCPTAQGAFYLYPNFENYREQLAAKGIKGSSDLSRYLAQHYNIMALPGFCFGASPEVLTLRLAPCDYDGAAVLTAREAEPKSKPDAFVNKHMPNIAGAAKGFGQFIADVTGKKVKAA